jgi:hypothetical protein
VPDEALTNAAVKWIQRMHDFVNSLDQPPMDRAMHMTDDFTYEDRRSGGMNFGRVDASGVRSYIGSMWDVGSGRPRMSMPEVIDDGDGNHVAGLVCDRLDPQYQAIRGGRCQPGKGYHCALDPRTFRQCGQKTMKPRPIPNDLRSLRR